MTPPPDPGILLRAHVVVAATQQPVTDGVAQVTYAPVGGDDAVTVDVQMRPVRAGEATFSFEVRIPAATALPGYPVDTTKALAVPAAPASYTRTIRIDGVVRVTETVTLAPEDVRASVATTTVTVDGDWFARGDLNSDGRVDALDWGILNANWQRDWRGRVLDLSALLVVLDAIDSSPQKPQHPSTETPNLSPPSKGPLR